MTISLKGIAWVIPEGWLYLGDIPTHCRSCDALVLWLESTNGKRAPMNPDGVSHFATCPDADRWRKKR
jgi:hypothetical protein